MDIKDRKKELRREVKALKALMDEASRDVASRVIMADLESSAEFRTAETVLAYWSMPDEVGTHEAIASWAAVKRVVLPVVAGDVLELREYRPSCMVEGYRGILEPSPESSAVLPSEVDLAIVPGVAFTPDGCRMGRGKGFYDKLLPELQCPLFGVAFSCQIFDAIPVESHDSKLDKVFTDAK